MILTQELWEEYKAAAPGEIEWEDLMESSLTMKACAAANALNWKLSKVTAAYEEERNNSINLHIENTKARKIIREFLRIYELSHFDLRHIINTAEEFQTWGANK